MRMKEKTVYQLCHMWIIYVRRYDIKYNNKKELEDKIYDIESMWDDEYLEDTFEYMPMEVHRINNLEFDMSTVYEDDIEDEKKLIDNIKERAKKDFIS